MRELTVRAGRFSRNFDELTYNMNQNNAESEGDEHLHSSLTVLSPWVPGDGGDIPSETGADDTHRTPSPDGYESAGEDSRLDEGSTNGYDTDSDGERTVNAQEDFEPAIPGFQFLNLVRAHLHYQTLANAHRRSRN